DGERLSDDPGRLRDHGNDPIRRALMRHIISILVENEAGALSRIAGLFSARGYNIETLTVAPTEDASMSRMTIVTSGSEDVLDQGTIIETVRTGTSGIGRGNRVLRV